MSERKAALETRQEAAKAVPLQAYNAVDAGLVSSFALWAGCALLAVQTVMVLAVLRFATVAAAAPVTDFAGLRRCVAGRTTAASARLISERARVEAVNVVPAPSRVG